MDNVRPVTKWQDGAGQLYDSEAEAIQGQARLVVRNIIKDATCSRTHNLDVEALIDRATPLIDALDKLRRARRPAMREVG